jgi:hypothetical protein
MKHFANFASLQIFLQMYFRCVKVCFNTTIEDMNRIYQLVFGIECIFVLLE